MRCETWWDQSNVASGDRRGWHHAKQMVADVGLVQQSARNKDLLVAWGEWRWVYRGCFAGSGTDGTVDSTGSIVGIADNIAVVADNIAVGVVDIADIADVVNVADAGIVDVADVAGSEDREQQGPVLEQQSVQRSQSRRLLQETRFHFRVLVEWMLLTVTGPFRDSHGRFQDLNRRFQTLRRLSRPSPLDAP